MDDNVKEFITQVADTIKKAANGQDVSREIARINYWILKHYPEAYSEDMRQKIAIADSQ